MSASLEGWLDPIDCNELLVPLHELGVKDAEDLQLLEEDDIAALCWALTKIQAKKLRRKIANPGRAIHAAVPEPQTSELYRLVAESSKDVSRPLPAQDYEMRDKLAVMQAEMARQAAADPNSDNSNASWAMPKAQAKAVSGSRKGNAEGAHIAGNSPSGHLAPMSSLASRFEQHGLAAETLGAESFENVPWMQTAEDWTSTLESADSVIFGNASAPPSYHQGSLSGSADERLLYSPELGPLGPLRQEPSPPSPPRHHQGSLCGGMDERLLYSPADLGLLGQLRQEPSPSNNGRTLPEAAEKPFLELAQKVERLERDVWDLQGWRVACASQASAPPPSDAAVMQRPVLGSPRTVASATVINNNKLQPRPHSSSAILQPAGRNATAGVRRLVDGRWTAAAGPNGESSETEQDTNPAMFLLGAYVLCIVCRLPEVAELWS